MINIFTELTKYDEGDDLFDEYLRRKHLFEIFKELLDDFPDKETFKKVVWFIMWAYSIDSDMLSTGGLDWSKLSERIFKKTGLDEKYYDGVANLKSDAVRNVIQRFLTLQNDANWVQYITYRDLRRQLLSASLSDIKKSTMEIDYATKMQCAVDSQKLLQMMNDAMKTFVQNNIRLKESVSALDKVINKKNTASVEDFLNA